MKGEFDSKVRACSGLVPSVDGREMYLYYSAATRCTAGGATNGTTVAEDRGPGARRTIQTSSAAWSYGATASFRRAAYTGGEFTTPPPVHRSGASPERRHSAAGLVRCELLDEKGQPLEGYRLEDCDVIHTTNEIDRKVKWRGRDDLAAITGRTVRLRVAFRDTDLYAFQFR